MLHDPQQEGLFPKIQGKLLEDLRFAGAEIMLQDGETLFSQGQRVEHFYVLLQGRLRVTRKMGTEEVLLTIHEPGEFTGDISMMMGGDSSATAKALGPSRVLKLGLPKLREVDTHHPGLFQILLRAASGRAQDVDTQARHQEKLAALGKLSASLAHELNNPAAAARSATRSLREATATLSRTALLYDCRLSESQRKAAQKLEDKLQAALSGISLDPLDRNEFEEKMAEWVESQGLKDGWKVTVPLVAAGLALADLQIFAQDFRGASLGAVLTWLSSSLNATELLAEVERCTGRISELVSAVKSYSHMDRAALQEVDVNQSLESTLRIFAHRLKPGVEVVRKYGTTLPKVCAYAGELNQVWTNLIDNALDAMGEKGRLIVASAFDSGEIVVEIGDTGPGIPVDIQPHIFDPFFTTKKVGEGTGLGLDISHRIVVRRHHGSIRFNSEPGNTRFQVRLPLQPPKEKDL